MRSRVRIQNLIGGSLRARIIAWSFVPTAIILLAVALVNFRAYQQVTEELVIEQDRDLIRLSAGQFVTGLTKYTDLLTTLARSADVYQNDRAAQRDALKGASNRLAVFDGGVLILDIFGTVVAVEPERPEIIGQDWSDRAYYHELVLSQTPGSISASARPVFSDIVADGPGGADVIAATVAIHNEGGEFVGAVVGMFRLGATAVSAFYGDIIKLRNTKGGSVYLVDGNGGVIYHSDADRIGEDLSTQAVTQQVLNEQTNAIRTRNLEGQDIVASFAPVPGTSWGLVTEESWTALTSGFQDNRDFLLVLLALGLALPAIVVSVGVRRITRPITELMRAAQEVARGNFGQTITARTGGEIGELARQFNLMSAQLQESYANLEQRVADRTRELAALNDERARRNRELALLNRVIAATTSRLEIKAVLEAVCRELTLAFNVPTAAAALLDEKRTSLNVVAEHKSEERPSAVGVVIPVENNPATQYVLEHKAPLAVADAQHDPRLTPVHDLMRERGVVSLLILPLIARDEVVGTIGMDAVERREYSDEEIGLAANVAAAAAQALENARAEEALRESEQTLKLAMEGANVGFWYQDLATGDRTMIIQDRTQDLGYVEMDAEASAQVTHPDDIAKVAEAWDAYASGKTPIFEVEYRNRMGSDEWRWVLVRGQVVVRDEHGEPSRMAGIFQDVTARVRAEAALRESQQRLTAHVQHTPLAYIEWDADLRVLDWNPAAERIFGYSEPEVLNRHAYEIIVPPEVRPHVTEIWQNLLNQTGGTRSTNENVTKDGRTIICEWYNTPLIDEDRNVIGLASLVQDITQRVQAEENLREAKAAAEGARAAAETANRAKSAFLANMSHELRTPLNAILGFSQLMLREALTGDSGLSAEQQENLEIIGRSGEHLLGLINDVLELSKIEAGRVTLQEKSFDLHRMLDGLEEMFYLRATNKGLMLIFDRAPDVPQHVRADEGKLRQVLMNLLGNAVKFTQEGGVTLRIGTKDHPPSVARDGPLSLVFEVEDTGPGIAPEELEAVFDPFEQTSSGRAYTTEEGTGLGLSISRPLVRVMGGELTVSSELGKGSLFKFDMQIELADEADVPTSQPARRVIGLEPDQPVYRLLVAEDREASRKLLVSLLAELGSPPSGPSTSSGRGFEVREAVNGREAVEIWEQWEPHLIWMDLRMPVMDGHEATQRIKATTRGQATVVIALTASAFEEDRATILSEGCDDFVRKPFREGDIFDMLTKHLGVRFVYEEIEREDRDRDREEGVLSAADVAVMPAEWVAELYEAATQLDADVILDLLDQVRDQNAPLADGLTNLVHNFRFDTVLALTQPTEE